MFWIGLDVFEMLFGYVIGQFWILEILKNYKKKYDLFIGLLAEVVACDFENILYRLISIVSIYLV